METVTHEEQARIRLLAFAPLFQFDNFHYQHRQGSESSYLNGSNSTLRICMSDLPSKRKVTASFLNQRPNRRITNDDGHGTGSTR